MFVDIYYDSMDYDDYNLVWFGNKVQCVCVYDEGGGCCNFATPRPDELAAEGYRSPDEEFELDSVDNGSQSMVVLT